MFRCRMLIAGLVVVSFSLVPAAAQDVTRIEAEQAQLSVLREVPISTEVTGTLVEVSPQEEGALVRKGDLLIRVNDAHIQAEVATAKQRAETMVEIDFAKTSKASAEQLLKSKVEANRKSAGVFNENEMRTAQLEVDKAVAQLAKAEEDKVIYGLTAAEKTAILNQYKVHAPFDGIVTKVHKFPAQNTRPGDPVLTLTDLSLMRAFVKVNIIHRQSLFVGDEVEFRINTAAKPDASSTARAVRGDRDGSAADFFNESTKKGPSAALGIQPAFLPAGEPVQDNDATVFSGTIRFVDPKVDTLTGAGVNTYAVTLSVDVPNPKDRFGRYLLQEGLPVTATILAKPRP